MAIEKEPNNIPNSQNTLEGTEDMQVAIEAIDEQNQEDFEIQEDGSAILGGMEEMPIDTDFNSNIAELLNDETLNSIAIELTSGIEKDKSSREDWEKTYTDGLKYLHQVTLQYYYQSQYPLAYHPYRLGLHYRPLVFQNLLALPLQLLR